VFQKNQAPIDIDNNFGKCGPIFKILLPGDFKENSLCTYRKDFLSNLQYFATLPCESRKSKNVTKFSC